MKTANPFSDLPYGRILDTALPDLILAFTFFTALAYATLAKRFDHQRAAAAMSAAIGMALSIGLVWWEQQQGLSIRNLGPIALIFLLIVLGVILYYAIRQAGGALAGTLIALGMCILMVLILGLNTPITGQAVQSVTLILLVVGSILFLIHHLGKSHPIAVLTPPAKNELTEIRKDIAELLRNRQVDADVQRRLKRTRQEAEIAPVRPEYAQDVVVQLQRLLPEEGWLTERLAKLRTKAHHVRKGHLARLEETQDLVTRLPNIKKKQAASDLAEKYRDLLDIDTRLERLDKTVAENERRIRQVTRDAKTAADKYDFRKLVELIESAQKLQGHNEELFKLIDRTEHRLSEVAEAVAKQYREVTEE